MPQQQNPYDIDDDKAVDQNLADFADALKKLDEPLAFVLTPHLVAMSNGAHSGNAGLLNALYAKTAPELPQPAANGVAEGPAAEEGEQ